MKILIIIPEFGTGGAERVVESLIRGLKAPDNQMTLLVFNSPDQKTRIEKLDAQTKIHFLFKERTSDLSFLFRFSKFILSTQGYDIILANLQPSAYYLSFLISFIRKPVIYIVHNEYVPLKSRWKRFVLQRFYQSNMVNLVSVSEQISNHFAGCFGVTSEVIDNGVLPPAVTDAESNVKREVESYKRDKETIVFIGIQRLVWFKNLYVLAEVFKEIADKGYNAILILLGDDPTMENTEKQRIESVGASNVFLLGQKGNIADYLTAADCFCIVSTAFEGLPIALLEAISVGLPVIGTRVGGISSVIKDPRNGIICEPTSESIKEAVIRFMRLSPEERMQIRKNNKQLFNEYFDERIMVSKYKELIYRLSSAVK